MNSLRWKQVSHNIFQAPIAETSQQLRVYQVLYQHGQNSWEARVGSYGNQSPDAVVLSPYYCVLLDDHCNWKVLGVDASLDAVKSLCAEHYRDNPQGLKAE